LLECRPPLTMKADRDQYRMLGSSRRNKSLEFISWEKRGQSRSINFSISISS
jgi:hypothetical protein